MRLGPIRCHIVLHLHTRKTKANPLSRIQAALVRASSVPRVGLETRHIIGFTHYLFQSVLSQLLLFVGFIEILETVALSLPNPTVGSEDGSFNSSL